MDADSSGDIDLNEWTTCMTKELRIAIYKSLHNPDKCAGFKPLVDVAKVWISFYFISFFLHIIVDSIIIIFLITIMIPFLYDFYFISILYSVFSYIFLEPYLYGFI